MRFGEHPLVVEALGKLERLAAPFDALTAVAIEHPQVRFHPVRVGELRTSVAGARGARSRGGSKRRRRRYAERRPAPARAGSDCALPRRRFPYRSAGERSCRGRRSPRRSGSSPGTPRRGHRAARPPARRPSPARSAGPYGSARRPRDARRGRAPRARRRARKPVPRHELPRGWRDAPALPRCSPRHRAPRMLPARAHAAPARAAKKSPLRSRPARARAERRATRRRPGVARNRDNFRAPRRSATGARRPASARCAPGRWPRAGRSHAAWAAGGRSARAPGPGRCAAPGRCHGAAARSGKRDFRPCAGAGRPAPAARREPAPSRLAEKAAPARVSS